MDTTVAPAALSHGKSEDVKPAMAGQRPANAPLRAAADQGLRPVDPLKKPPAPLGSTLGIKMTAGLREAVGARARADGVSDSAWLRHLVLRECGLESETDAATGPRPRIPPEELEALSRAVREIGELHQAAAAGKSAEVLAGLARVRAVIIPVCVGLARQA